MILASAIIQLYRLVEGSLSGTLPVKVYITVSMISGSLFILTWHSVRRAMQQALTSFVYFPSQNV